MQKKLIGIRLSAEIYEKIKLLSDNEHLPVSTYINSLVSKVTELRYEQLTKLTNKHS